MSNDVVSYRLLPRSWYPVTYKDVLYQGRIFEQVIEGTGDQSRIDFEEHGVNQQTLEDMKQVSQLRTFEMCTPIGLSP